MLLRGKLLDKTNEEQLMKHTTAPAFLVLHNILQIYGENDWLWQTIKQNSTGQVVEMHTQMLTLRKELRDKIDYRRQIQP